MLLIAILSTGAHTHYHATVALPDYAILTPSDYPTLNPPEYPILNPFGPIVYTIWTPPYSTQPLRGRYTDTTLEAQTLLCQRLHDELPRVVRQPLVPPFRLGTAHRVPTRAAEMPPKCVLLPAKSSVGAAGHERCGCPDVFQCQGGVFVSKIHQRPERGIENVLGRCASCEFPTNTAYTYHTNTMR